MAAATQNIHNYKSKHKEHKTQHKHTIKIVKKKERKRKKFLNHKLITTKNL